MMLVGFLEVGSMGFWAVLLLSAFVVSSLVDDDRYGGATLVALGSFALLALLGDFNPIALIRAHPHQALLAVPAYLSVGVLWCFIKWTLHVESRRRRAASALAAFEKKVAERLAGIVKEEVQIAERRAIVEQRRTKEGETSWPSRSRTSAAIEELDARALRCATARADLDEPVHRRLMLEAEFRGAGLCGEAKGTVGKPLVRGNKARIMAWLSYWPASMAWTVIDDPVRRAFVAIYENIGGSLQRIADRRFAGVEAAFEAAATGGKKG